MVLSSYESSYEEVVAKNGSSYMKSTIVPVENCAEIPRQVSKTVLASYQVQCPGDGTCSNQGICDVSTGNCDCNPGYQGIICQGKNSLQLKNVHPWNETKNS